MASLMKKLQQKAKFASAPQDLVESDNNSASAEEEKVADKVMTEEEAKGSDEEAEGEMNEIVNLDPEDDLRAFKDADPASKEWKNRQRTLVLCSRGIAGRMRHLVKDLCDLIPNTKVESKVNRKDAGDVIDEMCFEKSCNNCMFFEQRKQKDLFMWLSKSPVGPSAKF